MRRSMPQAIIATILLLVGTCSTQAALVNGGFDDYTNEAHQKNMDVLTPVSWIENSLGDPQIENSRSNIVPQAGDYFLIFNNSAGGGAVSQNFATVAGATYDLSFHAARPNPNQTPTVDVDIFDGSTSTGSGDLLDKSVLVDFADDAWVQQGFTFTAASTSTTLRFTDAGITNSVDPAIDSVALTEIAPLPAFVNGGFDDYANEAHATNVDLLTPVSWMENSLGDPQIENSRSAVTPQAGDYFLIFAQNPGGGAVSQYFTTVPGATYDLSFHAARPNATQPAPTVGVDVFDGNNRLGNGDLLSESVLVDFPDDTWAEQTFSFTAASTSTTLRFADIGNSTGIDPIIDSIMVTEASGGVTMNLSLDKQYAYYKTAPGQAPDWYYDDVHAVTTEGLGVFSTGDLTDGVLALNADDRLLKPGPVVAIRGSGDAPAADIIFDLEDVFLVEEVIVGTSESCCGNVPPDDVSVQFSTTGIAAGDFGAPLDFTLWSSDLGDGHFEIALDVGGVAARYVKLAFDGGVAYGTAEKYILDEITINGSAITGATVPEPSSLLLAALAVIGLMGVVRRS